LLEASAQRLYPRALQKFLLFLVVAILFVAERSSVLAAGNFVDVSSQVGLVMEAKKSKGSPVWGDFNNDGVLDLIVPCHGLSLSHGPFVYLGNANGTFTDIRATCRFSNTSQLNDKDSTDWHGFSLGDYDNDGNLDLYIAEGARGKRGGMLKRDLLFRGHGDGTFTYVSDIAGIATYGDRGREGFWFDYDNDGKLDLFVKNYKSANGFTGANRLYHNNGDGTFTQIAGAAGLEKASYGINGGAVTSFVDYDNDGLMDVAFSGEGASEALYHHQADGTFVEVTAAAGIKARNYCQGIAWGDYNNDGLLDLYIARGNLSGKGNMKDTLYRNNGDGTFTDVTTSAGLGTTSNTWAAVWGDYDNDGFLDLFVACAGATKVGAGNANLLYHNNGNGTFTNVAAAEGVQLDDGGASPHRCAAWADYNNDGFLDLIIKDGCGPEKDTGSGFVGLHRLFKNTHSGNNFIKVNLKGVFSNNHGIGARVTATYTGGVSFRENNGGGGGEFWSQGSEPLHFGIGTATAATVRVVWPSGVVDVAPSVTANSTINVVEGSLPPK
jgi:ASPIC and UnbV/FG-GAP-like repeat